MTENVYNMLQDAFTWCQYFSYPDAFDITAFASKESYSNIVILSKEWKSIIIESQIRKGNINKIT